jgi:hypothetical protein
VYDELFPLFTDIEGEELRANQSTQRLASHRDEKEEAGITLQRNMSQLLDPLLSCTAFWCIRGETAGERKNKKDCEVL